MFIFGVSGCLAGGFLIVVFCYFYLCITLFKAKWSKYSNHKSELVTHLIKENSEIIRKKYLVIFSIVLVLYLLMLLCIFVFYV